MRVFFNSLRCFFFAIRLRRFLITEPTVYLSGVDWSVRYRRGPDKLGCRARGAIGAAYPLVAAAPYSAARLTLPACLCREHAVMTLWLTSP